MSGSDLQQARAAKAKLMERLADAVGVAGVGLGKRDGGYVIQVNVSAELPAGTLPEEVDGIPVRSAVVGRITALESGEKEW